MEVSSTSGNVLQSIQALGESPRQSSSAQQGQPGSLQVGDTRGLNESGPTNTPDTQNEIRAVNTSAESSEVNDDERVGTLIDVQA